MSVTEASQLTRREREVAAAYAGGASHRAIGEQLFIAPATVRTHIGTIYRKLGVSSKIALLRTLDPLDAPPAAAPEGEPVGSRSSQRASIAVMPFRGDVT